MALGWINVWGLQPQKRLEERDAPSPRVLPIFPKGVARSTLWQLPWLIPEPSHLIIFGVFDRESFFLSSFLSSSLSLSPFHPSLPPSNWLGCPPLYWNKKNSLHHPLSSKPPGSQFLLHCMSIQSLTGFCFGFGSMWRPRSALRMSGLSFFGAFLPSLPKIHATRTGIPYINITFLHLNQHIKPLLMAPQGLIWHWVSFPAWTTSDSSIAKWLFCLKIKSLKPIYVINENCEKTASVNLHFLLCLP